MGWTAVQCLYQILVGGFDYANRPKTVLHCALRKSIGLDCCHLRRESSLAPQDSVMSIRPFDAVPSNHASAVVPVSASMYAPLAMPAIPPTPDELALPRHFKHDVFLSHKRTDTQDFARALKSELSHAGY